MIRKCRPDHTKSLGYTLGDECRIIKQFEEKIMNKAKNNRQKTKTNRKRPLLGFKNNFSIYTSINVSSASTYSKIRIALPETEVESVRIANVWPYFKESRGAQRLLRIGDFRRILPVKQDQNKSIQLYPITKTEIDALENKILLGHAQFNSIRDYFEVKRFKMVMNSFPDATINYSCYNTNELSNYSRNPWKSNNEDDLNVLFDCWGFFSIADFYKVKLPAVYGKLLLDDFLLLKKDIIYKPIQEILSKKIGSDDKTIRYFILENDLENYNFVSKLSIKNMKVFIKDKKLLSKVSSLRPEYEIMKEDRKRKK
ncbi:MAG: hypothetical protein HeimC3_53060 [Candidatus Heimdallarchaeota archaeon LC_3]|nr:MAG: hypothetical protein HeimC3_53060 [Candidatus Heimdallarchaeota archaeon LC_3]